MYANRTADSVIFAGELERLRSASGGRLSVHHHLDSERGFLDAAQCKALIRDRAQGDFYICGPGPYMDTVEAGLSMLGVAPSQRFLERFPVPADVPTDIAADQGAGSSRWSSGSVAGSIPCGTRPGTRSSRPPDARVAPTVLLRIG